jgi:hypothetical protein
VALRRLSGAGAAAELFFVAADFGGEGFDAGAELVDLDCDPGEGERFAVACGWRHCPG